jgi:hypothetical protein
MKFFLVICLAISIIDQLSAFENCGIGHEDPKLTHALDEFLEYFPFDQLSQIAQDYLPEYLRFYSFAENFTNSLPANPKINRALKYICEKTHFDFLGWWKGFWSNIRKEYFFF